MDTIEATVLDPKDLVQQRPELKYAKFLVTRGERIWAATTGKTLKVFRRNEDGQFQCVKEFSELIVNQYTYMLESTEKEQVFVTFFGKIKRIEYHSQNDSYYTHDVPTKNTFAIIDLVELDNGTLVAAFGNHIPGKSYPLEVVWGGQSIKQRAT